MTNQNKNGCAPSETGCLRCETVDAGALTPGAWLLLGSLDVDAHATLMQALETESLEFFQRGPALALPHTADRIQTVIATLTDRLNLTTQEQIRCAFFSGDIDAHDSLLAAFFYALPLSKLAKTMEFEWVRAALNEDWLCNVFHPIADAATGDVFAYELLLRARNPHTGEMIGAWPIIQACEQLNIQHQLDQRARRVAIRSAAALSDPNARFFINFLPNAIYDPEICLRNTMAAAQEYGVPMSRLVFEVVETEKIPDTNRLRRILDYYRGKGVGTAVDDMGAGFTSLRYLSELHPDFVKIDRDVVVRAENCADTRAQLAEIIAYAKRLSIRVIAEGIETQGQMQVCLEAGADYFQGFLFARPANPPESVSREHFPVLRRAA